MIAEDPRISEIRAVLDNWNLGNVTDDALIALDDIRGILDRGPSATTGQERAQLDQIRAVLKYLRRNPYMGDLTESIRKIALDRIRGVLDQPVLASNSPTSAPASVPNAPRVFFPGDTVEGGTLVADVDGAVHDLDWDPWRASETYVEIHYVKPTPEEWQAAVDRARDARADAEWQHTEGTNP